MNPNIKIKVPFLKRWRVMKAVVRCDSLTQYSITGSGFAVYADTRSWEVQVRRTDFVPPAGMVEIYRTKKED